MFELVELDPTTGEEDSLLCTGTWERMTAARDEVLEQADDDGYDVPVLMIQPAA